MSDELQGTLIRGADGSLYFVRDEILEACKVTENDMAEFCDGLIGGDVEGFGMSFGPISKSVVLRGPFAGGQNPMQKLGNSASSTVMCPGSMKEGAFEVINPGMSQGL